MRDGSVPSVRHGWLVAAAVLMLTGCASTGAPTRAAVHRPAATTRSTPAVRATAQPVAQPHMRPLVVLHRAAAGAGQGPVTVVVLDQSRVRLVLHAGTLLPGRRLGWHSHGPVLSAAERRALLMVFNGGFKIPAARGGWLAEGRVAVPLVRGAASVVTYADGSTDIGSWGTEVPAPGRTVATVRQNLRLLVDGGRAVLPEPTSQAELEKVWGHTFRHAALVSRSGLGVTADGRLVWAAGTRVTVRALDDALLAQGVVRAAELDINAPLVRGFLVRRGALVPLVVGQTQGGRYPATGPVPHCTYLTMPCPRDFFTVVAR